MRFLLLSLSIFAFTALAAQNNKRFELALSIHSNAPVHISYSDFNQGGGTFSKRGYAVGIMGKYFTHEGFAYRLQAVFSQRNNLFEGGQRQLDGSYDKSRSEYYQSVVRVVPGLQWGFQQNRVSLHGGLGLPFTLIGKYIQELDYKAFNPANIQTYQVGSKNQAPGGFSVGMGIFAGSNFMLSKRLQIGLEFGAAYQYTAIGDKVKFESIERTSNVTNKNKSEYTAKFREFDFTNVHGSLLLSYVFN